MKVLSGGLLRGNPANHYPVMTVEEICELPVPKFAADNCVLFMWATFLKLEEAFEVIKAWGFKYSTVAFVWVKKTKNRIAGLWVWAGGREKQR